VDARHKAGHDEFFARPIAYDGICRTAESAPENAVPSVSSADDPHDQKPKPTRFVAQPRGEDGRSLP